MQAASFWTIAPSYATFLFTNFTQNLMGPPPHRPHTAHVSASPLGGWASTKRAKEIKGRGAGGFWSTSQNPGHEISCQYYCGFPKCWTCKRGENPLFRFWQANKEYMQLEPTLVGGGVGGCIPQMTIVSTPTCLCWVYKQVPRTTIPLPHAYGIIILLYMSRWCMFMHAPVGV